MMQTALSIEQQTIFFYAIAFVSSEFSLAKGHVDVSQCQHENFPPLFC